MAGQFLDDAGEIAAEAVADDRVRRFQFEPGDEVGIDRDGKVERPAERLGESLAAGSRFLGAERPGRGQPRRVSAAQPVAARLGQRRERLSETLDETVDAGRVGQASEEFGGDVDGKLRRAIGGRRVFGHARPAHFGRGGLAHLIDFLAGGGERRGALGLAVGGGLAQHVVAARGDPRAFRLGRLARRDRALLRGLRVVQEFRGCLAPLLDDPDDRAEQELAQNPDEDEDVDRL